MNKGFRIMAIMRLIKGAKWYQALAIVAVVVAVLVLTGCGPTRSLQLEEGERGAVCYGGDAESVNPFVTGATYGAGIEIATGDSGPLTAEDIAGVAEALGCGQGGS